MTRKIRSSTSRSRVSRHVLHRKDYLFMIAAETRCVVASLDLNVSQSSTPMSIFSHWRLLHHAQINTGIVVLAVAWPVAGLLAGVWIVLQVRQMTDTSFHWTVDWQHDFGRAYIISTKLFCISYLTSRNFPMPLLSICDKFVHVAIWGLL